MQVLDWLTDPLICCCGAYPFAEVALANFAANSHPDETDDGLDQRPLLVFSMCYIASSFALDRIDQKQAAAALECGEVNMN